MQQIVEPQQLKIKQTIRFLYFAITLFSLSLTVKSQNLDKVEYRESFFALEVCSTQEVSLCGNYFEQSYIREAYLLEIKDCFYDSYKNVYKLEKKELQEIKQNVGDTFLKINYPVRFLKKTNKFLKKNKLKEKLNRQANFIVFRATINIEFIEQFNIYIPDVYFRKDFYKKINSNKFLIKEIKNIEKIDESILVNKMRFCPPDGPSVK